MPLTNSYVLVPTRIEGKYLASPQQVTPPLADFTKLPYASPLGDVNADNPFLSDGIIHEPFAEPSFLLDKGLHLHFIIPHYLGQPKPTNGNFDNPGTLPAAPNRWLVTKTTGPQVTQWMIESDYIHHTTYAPTKSMCVIPFHEGLPYRYMGRTTLLSDNRAPGNTFKSISGKPLTVTGYGDINFSSFYPNCLGVFGFHDPDGNVTSNAKYTILGWNDAVEDDLLNETIIRLLNNKSDISLKEINTQLQNLFKVNVDLNGLSVSDLSGVRSLFYGEIIADGKPTEPLLKDIEIAVGNTGTEALSALMSKQLAGNTPSAKEQIEEQLEYVLLLSKLDSLVADVGPKFLEARHEKGFHAKHSGYLWQITLQHENTPDNKSAQQDTMQLPQGTATLLHNLNLAQQEYDQATRHTISLRKQLYADWYKYMYTRYPSLQERSAFPDADEVMYFIETTICDELNNHIIKTGSVVYGNAETSYIPTPDSPGENDLANHLSEQWAILQEQLTVANSQRKTNGLNPLLLSRIAAPVYWTPNAPVLLLSGIHDGTVDTNPDFPPVLVATVYGSSAGVNEKDMSDTTSDDSIIVQVKGKNTVNLSNQKWSPFILDWEVNLYETQVRDNQGGFDPKALANNFVIDQFGPEFQKNNYQQGGRSILSGSVMLSSHSKQSLLTRIRNFIKTLFKKNKIDYIQGKNQLDFLNASDWTSALQLLVTTPKSTPVSNTQDYLSNPIYTVWSTYQTMKSQSFLSQTLNGFNEACIMRKQVAQLPITEPLGFEYEKQFTRKVKGLVGAEQNSSPLIDFNFNPIRSGMMDITQLRIIDNFGFNQQINTIHIPTTGAETVSDKSGNLFLHPRVAQPARLNFRWIAASGLIEMNNDPASTPVCGWLMADYLNGTLGVFASDGSALGFVDQQGTWQNLPWNPLTTSLDASIENPFLKQVVSRLCSTNFFQDFLTVTQSVQNNIAAVNTTLFDTKAMLMGRPMAVVRAQLSFGLEGLPALEQSWGALLTDISANATTPITYADRLNGNWPSIKLPVRIGEHIQLNDGMIGYWKETPTGTLDPRLIVPGASTADVSNPGIDVFGGDNFQTQWLSLQDSPLTVTMLIDPRCAIHATSGILPVKSISIPTEQYLSALKKLALWFRSTAVLQTAASGSTAVELNLPAVTDYRWAWWDRVNGTLPIQKPDHPIPTSSSQIQDGWLLLNPNDSKTNKS